MHTCQHLDQPENGKADDQELDDGVEKNPEVQGHGPAFCASARIVGLAG
jgi:hypothetical protein